MSIKEEMLKLANSIDPILNAGLFILLSSAFIIGTIRYRRYRKALLMGTVVPEGSLSLCDKDKIDVWLDDERPMPDGFDVHVRTSNDAKRLIATGRVARISLDHDLGPDEAGSGYDVACFIEEMAFLGRLGPIEWSVHSQNPTGAKKMREALYKANEYWERHKSIEREKKGVGDIKAGEDTLESAGIHQKALTTSLNYLKIFLVRFVKETIFVKRPEKNGKVRKNEKTWPWL